MGKEKQKKNTQEEETIINYGEPDKDFHKLFLKRLSDEQLGTLGGKKTQVVFWVLQNLTLKNELKYSYREIAKKTGVSYQTVANTMKAMTDAKILRREGKVLIADPDIIFKGTHARRMNAKKAYLGIATPDKARRIWHLKDRISELDYELHILKQELWKEIGYNSIADAESRLWQLRQEIKSLTGIADSLEQEIEEKKTAQQDAQAGSCPNV